MDFKKPHYHHHQPAFTPIGTHSLPYSTLPPNLPPTRRRRRCIRTYVRVSVCRRSAFLRWKRTISFSLVRDWFSQYSNNSDSDIEKLTHRRRKGSECPQHQHQVMSGGTEERESWIEVLLGVGAHRSMKPKMTQTTEVTGHTDAIRSLTICVEEARVLDSFLSFLLSSLPALFG